MPVFYPVAQQFYSSMPRQVMEVGGGRSPMDKAATYYLSLGCVQQCTNVMWLVSTNTGPFNIQCWLPVCWQFGEACMRSTYAPASPLRPALGWGMHGMHACRCLLFHNVNAAQGGWWTGFSRLLSAVQGLGSQSRVMNNFLSMPLR
jgi:hypothetical protein